MRGCRAIDPAGGRGIGFGADIRRPQEKAVANLMVYWAVGYMHGRLGVFEDLTLDGGNHDAAVNDLLTALNRICPNVPEMPIATFVDNLAGDFERSLQQ